ncbi:hypothetical protein CW752_14105 [Chryseobacterium sp. PMSZPI]|nr:hypothetical protein CW752_14105 [Chryseobacterium sp. PMSZPI]
MLSKKQNVMNSMKKILFLTFCMSISLLFSQERKNVVALEFVGHSRALFSANYERLFSFNEDSKILFSARTGVGRSPGYEVHGEHFKGVTSLPVVLSALYGKKHFIQAGVGYTALFSEDFIDTSLNPNVVYKKFESNVSVSLGYRLMLDSGLVCQAYPMIVFRDNPQKKFEVSFGVGIGYSF